MTKGTLKYSKKKKIFLFNKLFWVNRIFIWKNHELVIYFTSYTKINSKWIILKNKTIKIRNLLEDNIGEYINDFGIDIRVEAALNKKENWMILKLKTFVHQIYY